MSQMSDILNAVGAWPVLLVALVVFGFAPGLVIRLVALCFRKDDPRRKEMIAEVYAVPRWDQPFWVFQQLERALSEGVWERVAWAASGRIYRRVYLANGVRRNRKYPSTFHIPSDLEKKTVVPGDFVKIEFGGGYGPERMWVKVVRAGRRRFVGTLANEPLGMPHYSFGKTIRFRAKHIIDIDVDDDEQTALQEAASGYSASS